MDTLVRPPAPPVEDHPTRRPRRPRRRIVAVLVGTIALVVAAGGTWIANVEPLGRGSVVFGTNAVRFTAPSPAPRVRSVEVSAFGVNGHVLRVPADHGTRFTYDVAIRNTGRVPVEILDGGTGEPGALLERRIVAADPDLYDGGVVGDGFRPFEPFTIHPGGQAGLRIQVTVRGNLQAGTTIGWYTEDVTFRILGMIERHTSVDTGIHVQLVGQRG